MTIHDLRLGCALGATLLPAVTLVRAASLHADGALPAWGGPAIAAYLVLALGFGIASLGRHGRTLRAGTLAAATCGFALGAAIGDPLLAAVPLAALPLGLALPSLGRSGADPS